MERGVNREEGRGQMKGEQGRGKNVEEEEKRENREEEEIVEKYQVEEAIGKRQEGRKREEILEEARGWMEIENGKEQDRRGGLEMVKRIEG